MADATNRANLDWLRALEAAGASAGRASGDWLLFFEDREDLTVISGTRSGLTSTQTRQVGVHATDSLESGRSLYLSDPGLDDIEPIMGALHDPAVRMPARHGPGTRDMGGLPPVAIAAGISRLRDEAEKLLPAGEITVRWVGFEQHVMIARPGRSVGLDRRRGSRVRVEARLIGAADPVLAVAERVMSSPDTDFPAELDRLVADVCERAERRIAVKDVPTGDQTVVFAPGVGGVLIHEIVGHALEGDIVSSGSWLSDRQDAVALATVVIVDDPRRSRAPWRIDDEGERSRPTPLILEGRVRGALLDRRTAASLGRGSTGHGRRASFREPVRPRMGSTFLGAGTLSADEVLEGTTGVYIRRMESARTNPRTGRAMFRVTDADQLYNGRCVGALRPFLMYVEGERVLSRIDRVGSDLMFDTCVGSCHRAGQALPISVGAPTFRSEVVTVAA